MPYPSRLSQTMTVAHQTAVASADEGPAVPNGNESLFRSALANEAYNGKRDACSKEPQP